jgi:hypothetical protein
VEVDDVEATGMEAYVAVQVAEEAIVDYPSRPCSPKVWRPFKSYEELLAEGRTRDFHLRSRASGNVAPLRVRWRQVRLLMVQVYAGRCPHFSGHGAESGSRWRELGVGLSDRALHVSPSSGR